MSNTKQDVYDVLAKEPDELDEISTLTLTIKNIRFLFRKMKHYKKENDRLILEIHELKQPREG